MRNWLIVAATAAAVCPAWAEPPWQELARSDLKSIHDLIEANHPGAVDVENPGFRNWLEKGYAKALVETKTVVSQGDYVRALRLYVNGFQDGHVGVGLKKNPTQISWTGFTVYGRRSDDIRVVYAEPDAGVHLGDRLLACDGKSVDALLTERIDRFYWNAAIAHARYLNVSRLFFQDVDDTQAKLKSCTFSSGLVPLKWRDELVTSARPKLSNGINASKMPSLRQVDGVWMISFPSFAANSEGDFAAFNAVLDDIIAHRSVLQASTVVIDVRRNGGGSSTWGDRVAAALWGQDWVSRIHRMGDGTLEFRASPENLAACDERIAAFSVREGADSAAVRYFTVVRAEIANAMEQHKPMARMEGKVRPVGPPPSNPMRGKVYFLTDNACGSACLDFADVMRRIPGVVHVGLPTSADSVYMEVNAKLLPSGLSQLSYPMKVYRHRLRKNNEYYVPEIIWTGGPMNDDAAIVAWIKALP